MLVEMKKPKTDKPKRVNKKKASYAERLKMPSPAEKGRKVAQLKREAEAKAAADKAAAEAAAEAAAAAAEAAEAEEAPAAE